MVDPHDQLWTGAERRSAVVRPAEPTPSQIMDALDGLALSVGELKAQQRDMRRELSQHMAETTLMVSNAFVDGDPKAHRREHEDMATRTERAEEDGRVLRRDLVRGTLWGSIVIAAGLLLTGALSRLKEFLR